MNGTYPGLEPSHSNESGPPTTTTSSPTSTPCGLYVRKTGLADLLDQHGFTTDIDQRHAHGPTDWAVYGPQR